MSKYLRSLFAALVLLSGAAWGTPYSGVYVFGDSLADSGNNAAVIDANLGGGRTPTPLSVPLIPTYPYASNRYSNGPVWVEYLAANLGLSAQPALLGGTNFAFGGARTGPAGSSFPYSMTDQVGMFLGATGGFAPGSALYVVEGGGNDARDVLMTVLGGGDPTALISAYASNMANILATLSAAGADQFLVWNIPDIGKIPAINGSGAVVTGLASLLVSEMNQALVSALTTLPAGVTDGVHLFDAFGALNGIVADPGAFGFSDVTSACAMSAACINDPSGNMFWDGIHPTTAGHAAMARLAMAEIPEPQTILLLAIGMFGVFVSRRKAG
jgi:outer membrane lipase/esterase